MKLLVLAAAVALPSLACDSESIEAAAQASCEDAASFATDAHDADSGSAPAPTDADSGLAPRDAVVRAASFGDRCDHTGYPIGSLLPFAPVADGAQLSRGVAHVTCTSELTSETYFLRASAFVENEGGFEIVLASGSAVSVVRRDASGRIELQRDDCENTAMPESWYGQDARHTIVCPATPSSDAGAARCGLVAEIMFRNCDRPQ